jgi:hypothetical protein
MHSIRRVALTEILKPLSLLRCIERLSIGVGERGHTNLAFLIEVRERQKN